MSNPIILTAGLDPTALPSIDGAELLQMVNSAQFASGIGGIVLTADVGGVPQLPDAIDNPTYKNFLWARVIPATLSMSLYMWNPNALYILSYPTGSVSTNWTPVATGSIPAGSIVGSMIANSTIEPANIDLAALITALGLTPASYLNLASTPTGGNISGSFGAGLTINNAAVTGAMIALATITGANIAAKTVAASNILGGAIITGQGQVLTTVDGANTAGWSAATTVGRILQIVEVDSTAAVESSGLVGSNTANPNYNATGMNAAFSVTMPTGYVNSANSTLLIDVTAQITTTPGAAIADVFVGLYNATGATSAVAGGILHSNTSVPCGSTVSFKFKVATAGLGTTWYVAFGTTAGTASLNAITSGGTLFAKSTSSIRVTEYI